MDTTKMMKNIKKQTHRETSAIVDFIIYIENT